MKRSRNTPDTFPPSLEGTQEREFLALYLEFWSGHTPPPGDYRLVRQGYELASLEGLPARTPRRFRRQAS